MVGKIAALTRLAPELVERSAEVLARVVLVISLWRFCVAFTSGRSAARWAMLLALFGGGFAPLAGAVQAPYVGNWSFELNTFGLLFAAPHVPLGMACTLELARMWLRPVARPSAWQIAASVGLGAAIALLHPFHEPVLLVAMLLVGLVFWRTAQGVGNLAGTCAAVVGALPVLWPTVQTFTYEPFWSAAYSAQTLQPSPAPHELLIDLGPTLVLALGGAYALRTRVAPFGILIWLLVGAVAMYAPVPYQRRLGFGLHPALAVVAANALVAAYAALSSARAAWVRPLVFGLAVAGSVFMLASTSLSSLQNAPTSVYRSTPDVDAAARWLDQHAQPGEMILADWNTSNYLAPRTPARVVGGHSVATLDAGEKQLLIATVFAHTASREVARQYGANWLVYGPDEARLAGPPDPAFQSGSVRVYRVDR
jgi:hypothetical protein